MTYFSQISFLTLSDLYTWMNQLSPEAFVVECGQLHRGQFLVLVQSPQLLEKPAFASDFFSTNKNADTLIRAYYKQNSIPLTKGLLLLEADHLSELFSCIFNDPQLTKAPLLEVSRSALPHGRATAIFVNASDINTKAFSQEIQATYFAQVNSHLRSLFEF